MVGRGTGRFMASNPLLYRRRQQWQTRLAHNSNSEFGPATVADSAGDRFRPGNGPQEAPRGNMYKPPHYSATPMLGPTHADDQRYRTFRSQDIGLEIGELKILANKHRSYLEDADATVTWAVLCSSKGDDRFLDDKLFQLRAIDTARRLSFKS
jgi:hypothetical protein